MRSTLACKKLAMMGMLGYNKLVWLPAHTHLYFALAASNFKHCGPVQGNIMYIICYCQVKVPLGKVAFTFYLY